MAVRIATRQAWIYQLRSRTDQEGVADPSPARHVSAWLLKPANGRHGVQMPDYQASSTVGRRLCELLQGVFFRSQASHKWSYASYEVDA
jgi:hypothetical protein